MRATLLLLSLPLATYAAEGLVASLPPLPLPSLAAGQSLSAGLIPRQADPRSPLQVRASGAWTNTWALGENREIPHYLVDNEATTSVLDVSVAVAPRLRLAATWLHQDRFGGGMDAFIQKFHNSLALDNGYRQDYPRGQLHEEVTAAEEKPGVSLSQHRRHDQVQAEVQATVVRGPSFALSVSAGAAWRGDDDLPWIGGMPLDGVGAVHAGFGFIGAQWNVSWGLIRHGRTYLGPARVRRWTQATAIAAAWPLGERLALRSQLHVSQGLLRRYWLYSDNGQEIDLGVVWRTGPALVELGIVENLLNSPNAPDFGVYSGVTFNLENAVKHP